MADDTLLYVSCPHGGEGATTARDTPRAAAADALVFDGARVLVLDGRKIVADVTVQSPKTYRDEAHVMACLAEAESRINNAVNERIP